MVFISISFNKHLVCVASNHQMAEGCFAAQHRSIISTGTATTRAPFEHSAISY